MQSRFDGLFTVGELQAMVTAFAYAGAYPRPWAQERKHPYNNPTWARVADEAAVSLERAVAAEEELESQT